MIEPIYTLIPRDLSDDDNANALGDFLTMIARPTLGGTTADDDVFLTPVDTLFDLIHINNRSEHFDLSDLFSDRAYIQRKYYVSLSVTRAHLIFKTYELPD